MTKEETMRRWTVIGGLILPIVVATIIFLFCGKPIIVWMRRIDTGVDEMPVAIMADDEQLVVVGNQIGKDGGGVWLVQWLNRNGELLRHITVTGGRSNFLVDGCLDKDGNIYLAGYTSQRDTVVAMVVKVSPAGRVLWKKGLVLGKETRANGICLVDTLIAITGGVLAEDTEQIFVAVLNRDGKTVWSRGYPGEKPAAGWRVKPDYQANLVVLARWGAPSDLVLLKIGRRGDTLWTRRYDSGGSDEPGDLVLDRFGNIVAVGTVQVRDSTRCVILEYTGDGGAVRKVAYGENAQATGWDICIGEKGNIFVGGTLFGAQQSKGLVFEYVPNAVSIWEQQIAMGKGMSARGVVYNHGLFVVAEVVDKTLDIAVLELSYTGR